MAVPSSLTVTVDKTEYSRYFSDYSVITALIQPRGTLWSGSSCVISLMKNRRAKDEAVASYTFSLSDSSTNSRTFDLTSLVDTDFINKVRRGSYFIKAVVTSGGSSITAVSPAFDISMIPVEYFKKWLLFGVPAHAFEQKDIKQQPTRLTGVTVIGVSKNHSIGWFPLTYSYDPGTYDASNTLRTSTVSTGSTDTVINITGTVSGSNIYADKWLNLGAEFRRIASHTLNVFTVETAFTSAPSSGDNYKIVDNTPVRMFSWCGGPSEVVSSTRSSYILRKGSSATEYIEIRVNQTLLGTSSNAEDLLIENAVLSNDKLKGFLDNSISWLEKQALGIYLEPTKIITEHVGASTVTYESNSSSTVPVFSGATFDEIVDPVSYYRPNPNHWLTVKLPYRPLLKVTSLYGKTGAVNTITINNEWIKFNSKSGFIELIPVSGETSYDTTGFFLVNAIHGGMTIPGFWNFDATVGFRELPYMFLEVIGKKAAIEALTAAGQAYRGGLSSSSLSRDGVSEGVSYLTTGPFGVYSATISQYNDFIQTELKKIRSNYLTGGMVVMN